VEGVLMLINKEILLTNLVEKPDEYRKQFPRMIHEIDEVVKKPKCGVCINAFFRALLNDMGFQQKLSVIFGEPELDFAQDIQDYVVSGKDKTALKSKTKVEVFWVPPKDVKKFIESYTEDKLVRNIQTTYVPAEKIEASKILVTIHWSSLT
jgi:hypothetical protein